MSEMARRSVVDACRALTRMHFLSGTGGNVSLRFDAARFVITPSAMEYDTMTGADLCVVNLNTLTLEEGTRKPSVESGLHAALYSARPEAAAVVHTHQPLASAVALLGVQVPVNGEELRQMVGPFVPAVSYAPSGTVLLIRALRKALRPDANAYLLRNHGLICCGKTMASAISAAREVEELARRYIRSAISSAAVSELRRQVLEALQ